MSDKTDELLTIRDILMGQHVKAVEEKFAEMRMEIQNLKAEISELKKIQTQDKESLSHTIMDKSSNLEKMMAQNIEAVKEKLKTTNKGEKETLANFFMDFSKKLSESVNP